MRASAGIPSRYLLVSSPWATAVNAIIPAPVPSSASRSSGSTHRLNRLYDGWWISSGTPSERRISAASRVLVAEYDEIPT